MEPGSRSYSDNLGRRFSRNHDGISNAACMDPHPPPQRLLSSSVIAHCAVWQVSLPLPRPLPLLGPPPQPPPWRSDSAPSACLKSLSGTAHLSRGRRGERGVRARAPSPDVGLQVMLAHPYGYITSTHITVKAHFGDLPLDLRLWATAYSAIPRATTRTFLLQQLSLTHTRSVEACQYSRPRGVWGERAQRRPPGGCTHPA